MVFPAHIAALRRAGDGEGIPVAAAADRRLGVPDQPKFAVLVRTGLPEESIPGPGVVDLQPFDSGGSPLTVMSAVAPSIFTIFIAAVPRFLRML